jgi:thiamine pyrophosphokinase
MSACHLVGAGEFFGPLRISDGDLIVAADGGLDSLQACGIKPDALVGDMDSLSKKSTVPDIEIIRHPVEKDETDMFLAYEYGREKGYKKFFIYGGTGGRQDHTFANYCLLLMAKRQGNEAILVGDGVEIFAMENDKAEIFGSEGSSVSIFAFGVSEARGVYIKGLKYEAENITLSADFPLGVSNSFTALGRGEISVDDGALLVMKENK